MKYARQNPPDMKMFYENYIEYLDTLSPQELLSSRYVGQREMAVRDYERLIREEGGTPDDMTSSQNPIFSLFELLKEVDFNIKDEDSFIKTYEERVSPLLNREGNENLKSLSNEALGQLKNINEIIFQARDVSKEALKKLHQMIKMGDPK